ncbi:glutamine synthetase family protein [Pseudotabrizicola sp. L79]|uniref:glutamine synthetase family protein n=1 Tax=Pseudotabrizicola sp. L79 TaxID=3118402 RepID=UPI002F93833B
MTRSETGTRHDLAGYIAETGATHVHIGVFDTDGALRVKRVPAGKAVKMAASGYQFCDVLYAWDTAEVTYGSGVYIDRPATIFADTIRPWPFEGNEAICIADFDAPFGAVSARNQLIEQLQKAQRMGFSVHSAFEFEFNILEETAESLRKGGFADPTHFAMGNRTYSLGTLAEQHDLLTGLEDVMRRLGISFDALHTELGPGCLEVPLSHAEGIKAADDAALFKNFTKTYFRRHGLTACFMSKLKETLSGQSGHLHVSLRNLSDGSAAFHDRSAPDAMSQTERWFIGGLMQLMPEMLALCSQTVNAYKRMVPGMWAPTYASWGIQNRTVALRVMNDSAASARVEFRVPSADTHPHAALAMCLGAGLWGIENRIEPCPPRTDDCYLTPAPAGAAFPRDLADAADRLDASTAARAIFGDTFITTFVAARKAEDAAWRRHVSAWEVTRYLETV